MKAIFAREVGKVALSEYDDKCDKAPVDATNTKSQGRHERRMIGVNNWDEVNDGPWPCDHCGKVFEVGTGRTLYDTESGHLEPGCLYWDDNLPENYYWDNHHGPMLHVVLPNGKSWNIDSRASNCTRKDDRTHRCWVRTGVVPNIHVHKDGDTCHAGAGSIFMNQGQPDEWHGFLHHGELHT